MNSLTWENDILLFAKLPVLELARAYQTPLFVYDQDQILSRINEVKKIAKTYHNISIYYASKAFLTLAMAKIIKDSHLGIDVASRGELFIALKGNIQPSDILYHGNNKSIEDIHYAIEQGVRKFVVDSVDELMHMKELTDQINTHIEILIRIIPKIDDINTHKNITTGHHGSKFGIDMDLHLEQVASIIKEAEYLSFQGLHFHVGSQLFTNTFHLQAVEQVFKYMQQLRENYQIVIKEINIGGGFGIKYKEQDQPMPLQLFIEPIIKRIDDLANIFKFPMPKISIEPGRFIVGGTALILYTVGAIKPGTPSSFVAIDGGMTENLRVALYQAQYDVICVNKTSHTLETYTVVGQACESTDLMVEHAKLPKLKRGDTLAFLQAGAYEHSLIHNFNKTLRPTVLMVHQGVERVIQQRETYEALIARDFE